MSEICLPHNDAPAKMGQTLGHVADCIRVLIQSYNVGATFKEGFGVTAAAACRIQNQQACFRVE